MKEFRAFRAFCQWIMRGFVLVASSLYDASSVFLPFQFWVYFSCGISDRAGVPIHSRETVLGSYSRFLMMMKNAVVV